MYTCVFNSAWARKIYSLYFQASWLVGIKIARQTIPEAVTLKGLIALLCWKGVSSPLHLSRYVSSIKLLSYTCNYIWVHRFTFNTYTPELKYNLECYKWNYNFFVVLSMQRHNTTEASDSRIRKWRLWWPGTPELDHNFRYKRQSRSPRTWSKLCRSEWNLQVGISY